MKIQIFTLLFIFLHTIHGFTCKNDGDCNNHGQCNNGKCKCDPAYMEPDCTYFPFKVGVAYPCFFYPMSFVTLVLWIATSFRLFQLIRTFKTLSKWKEEFSVRHLAIIMLWIGLMGRIIFFATNIDGDWDRNTEGFFPFFFYIFYPCVAVAFSCELLVWMELYTTTTLHNIEKLPKYRKYLLIFNAVVFPIEITLRIAITVSPITILLSLVWFSFLGILVFSETIGFLVISGLLLRKVMRMKALTGQNQQRAAFTKLTGTLMIQTFIVIFACLLFVATTFTATKRAEMFLLVNVLARIVEFVAVIFILVIIKPQPPRTMTTVSSIPTKMSSLEKSNSDSSTPMEEL